MRCTHRINIYLTDEQRAALAARAVAEGTSAAEVVRRLIDQALLRPNDDFTGDLAAIEVSFGVLRGSELDIDDRSRT